MRGLPCSKRAFTLIEILAVLVLISIASSVILPDVNGFFASERCKGEAERFIQGIRLAKYSAMQTQNMHFLVCETGEKVKFASDTYNYITVLGYGIYDYNEPPPPPGDGLAEKLGFTLGDSGLHDPRDATESVSILDNEDCYLDGPVDMYAEASGPIYFFNDGTLKELDGTKNTKLLTEKKFIFLSGGAAILVYVNAYGVLSSEAVAVSEADDGSFVFGENDIEDLW